MPIPRISAADYYQRLNFHPPQLNKTLDRWLGTDEGNPSPLVVAGEVGSGRSYLVWAAAFRAGKSRNLPFQVMRLDCRLLDVMDPEKLIARLDRDNILKPADRTEMLQNLNKI